MTKRGNPHTLRPFKKGEDSRRNLNGQPRKLPRLDQLLAHCLDGELELILNALIAKAKKGDIRAAELLLDRSYGKVKPPIDSNWSFDPLPGWPDSML